MELFGDGEERHEGTTGESLAKRFGELTSSVDHSSPNAHKNKPLEKFLARHTGWEPVAFKFVGERKNLYNRISEIRNRPDRPRHIIALVPSAILHEGVIEARKLIAERPEFDVIGIATTDSKPPA